MEDLTRKLRRQIEIIGLVMAQPGAYTFGSLADLFLVDDETVKKDLSQLRSSGVPINQIRGKGIHLSRRLNDQQLQELITQYCALSITGEMIDKATRLLVKKNGAEAFSQFVIFQRCIDKSLKAIVDYQKDVGVLEVGKVICPLRIFQSEGAWRLLALDGVTLKQYHFSKIVSVKASSEKFKKVPRENLEELFRYSWKSWLGKERHKVKLRISKDWAEALELRPVSEEQSVSKIDERTFIFEITVNTLDEIARWIAGQGGTVVAVEPKALAEIVRHISELTLKGHQQ